MPAAEQTITDLQAELDGLAEAIRLQSVNLNETILAHSEADEVIAQSRAEKLSTVLNARFEINNRLQYTNDDQRKVAVLELEIADLNLQQMKSTRTTLLQTRAEQEAEVEKNQNLHKSKLLVLQYYANLP